MHAIQLYPDTSASHLFDTYENDCVVLKFRRILSYLCLMIKNGLFSVRCCCCCFLIYSDYR